jgi:hypothetical protein
MTAVSLSDLKNKNSYRMKKIIAILFITALFLAACKKEKNNDTCAAATVQYAGDPAADGLGWILVTDSVNWKYLPPEEIPADYKVNGLAVDVCYVTTENDFICFCPQPRQKVVRITSISRR